MTKALLIAITAFLTTFQGVSQGFIAPEYLSSTAFELRGAALIDVDGDHDLDVLAGGIGFNTSGIETWINQGTSFSLAEGNIPFSNLGSIVFAVADVNMDGSQDFAAVVQDNLVWYANDGSGNFSNPMIIAENMGDVRSLTFGQLDSVAGQELVVTRIDVEDVLLFSYEGNSNFGNPIVVTTQAVDPIDAKIGDFDGDGLDDIAIACLNVCDVTWHKNLGGLTFGQQVSLGTNQIGTYELALADYDNNGHLDIASVGFGSDDLSIWFNSGGGSFGSQNIVSSNVDGATSIAVGDFNSDGNDDLCVGAENMNYPTLFIGQGNGTFTEMVLDGNGSVNNPEEYLVGDVNNDGKLDLVTASQGDNKLSLFLQVMAEPTSVPFGSQIVINQPASGINQLSLADIDGDGDQDLISSNRLSGSIDWFENTNAGGLGKGQALLDLNEGIAGVAAGDLNGDNQTDLVVSNTADSTLTIFLKSVVDQSFVASVLENDLDGPYSPVLSDLDNDADLDILLAVGWEQSVYLYQNQGNGTFANGQLICGDCLFATALVARDLNGDHLPEILVYKAQNQEIDIYQNEGNLQFGDPELLIDNVNGCRDIEFLDFDGDGDLDVFAAALFVNRIKFVENHGGLLFSQEEEVPFNVSGVYDLEASDVDLDGDDDLIYADFFANQIRFIIVEDGQFIDRRGIDNVFENPITLVAHDFNQDGSDDLCAGFRNYVTFYANEAEACDFFQPMNLDFEINTNFVQLHWDPVPETVACRVTVQEMIVGSEPQSQNILQFEPQFLNIPLELLSPGSAYNWRVQCACSIGPVDATSPSEISSFAVPNSIEVYPNPAINQVQIENGNRYVGALYTLFDQIGRVVQTGVYHGEIEINSFEKGVYILEVDGQKSKFLKN